MTCTSCDKMTLGKLTVLMPARNITLRSFLGVREIYSAERSKQSNNSSYRLEILFEGCKVDAEIPKDEIKL